MQPSQNGPDIFWGLVVGRWEKYYKVGELGMVVTVSSRAQRQAFRQTKKGLWEGLQSQKWVVGWYVCVLWMCELRVIY